MQAMAIDRRSFVIGAAASAVAAAHPPSMAFAREAGPLYAAARKGPDGRYSAAVFAADGRDVNAVLLPGRGHDITVSPASGDCVVFARRPGNFAIAFVVDRRRAPVTFTTPADRHFYGHGVFSRDGRLLYATENDFERRRGIIGIYDVGAGYRRIGEFASGGIGPHDLALVDAGRVLVVANGGFIEHPDIGGGRRIINPDAVETTLAYIELRSGALLERHDLGAPGTLSLRHLDVARDGTVVIGAQLTGTAGDARPLIYRHRRQQPLATIALPDEVETGLAGYISSIACDRAGEIFAATSARGGLMAVIDIASGEVLDTRRLEDISGIAPTPDAAGFLATAGTGRIAGIHAVSYGDVEVTTSWAWDNHAILVTAGRRA